MGVRSGRWYDVTVTGRSHLADETLPLVTWWWSRWCGCGMGWGGVWPQWLYMERQTLSLLAACSQLTSDLVLSTALPLSIYGAIGFPLFPAPCLGVCDGSLPPGESEGTFIHCTYMYDSLPLPPSISSSFKKQFNVSPYVLLPQQLMDTGSFSCLT